jgi:hypothetical protein
MSFYILTDTGKTVGPYGNMVIARREARGKIAGNTRIKEVEIRYIFSRTSGDSHPSIRVASTRNAPNE